MREILFRGKAKAGYKWISEGEWIEGSLFYSDDENGIVCQIVTSYLSSNKDEPVMVAAYEVDPETACQYTGLTDKNGRKIFEGDIVQDAEFSFEGYEPYIKGIVKFRTGTFDSGCYEYNGWVIEEKDGNIDHTPLLQYEKEKGYLRDSGFEVIGNIFDNPELIGEQP